jgi:DNA adenine methylase
MNGIVAPAIRYHGAKYRLASWIMQFFPPHRIYVEPFGGAAGVLLQKPRAYSEVYNDLDGDLVNFFRIMQNDRSRERLIDLLVMTPYAREEFDVAWQPADDPIEQARRLIVRAQMGFGSAGATKGTTGFRVDTKREYETAQHTWAQYPSSIEALGMRLTGVLIENRPAIQVIGQHDTAETLFYVDPPYVLDTRAYRNNGAYRHEMSDADHLELISMLRSVQGMVVLSGYSSELYGDALADWDRHTTTARISAGRGTGLREEVIWLNPACADSLGQNIGGLFA